MIYLIIVSFSLALLLRPAYSRAQPAKSGNSRFATVGAEDNVVKRLCITHDYNILVCVRFMLRAFSTLTSRVPPQPHTALHFVALMWGYLDSVLPARKVLVSLFVIQLIASVFDN